MSKHITLLRLFFVICLISIFLLVRNRSLYTVTYGASTLPGDADNNCHVDGIDFVVWLNHYNQHTSSGSSEGDFDVSGIVDGVDFSLWLSHYGEVCTEPTPNPQEIDIAVCDPANSTFSSSITNPYLPFPVGMKNVLESEVERVEITVLEETKVVNSVTTRVVQEYETTGGVLLEISRNYFAQAPDGTVCYFGEDVDIYNEGQIVSHDGTWLAGVGENKAGIMMPANPAVGQTFWIEKAPGIAEERGQIIFVDQPITTPYSTFPDALYIEERSGNDISQKYYARGAGMVIDELAKLVSRSGISPTPTP